MGAGLGRPGWVAWAIYNVTKIYNVEFDQHKLSCLAEIEDRLKAVQTSNAELYPKFPEHYMLGPGCATNYMKQIVDQE